MSKPLRLWPGVVVAVLVVLLRFVVPLFVPGAGVIGVLAGVAGFALILLWWLFFSRAPWIERLAAIVVMVAGGALMWFVVHPSIRGGMMGRMLPMLLLPVTLGPALVLWAVATRRSSAGARRASMVGILLLACGIWGLARTDGIIGEADSLLRWRWTPTAEERLLAQEREEPVPPPPVTVTPAATREKPTTPAAEKEAPKPDAPATADPVVVRAEWSGFRGPRRDGVVGAMHIATDWSQSKPVELWRKKIGPGWSSFAAAGDLIYTQEQRGDEEIVSAYRLSNGAPVWKHRDTARFYESNAGPGPRGTPTVHSGRVYSLGATGIVNALDARTGARIWTRNAQADTGAPMPEWGYTSSPLVVDDVVIVAVSGRLVGYDVEAGNPRWTLTTVGGSYSSPHLATIGGVQQVILLSGAGATGVSPADGTRLWQFKAGDGTNIVQPAIVDGDVLVSPGDAMGGMGMRRITVSRAEDGTWKTTERWTSRGLKPYHNDFVVHKGHAYGFDGTILSAISLADGERKWKGGRYGAGQMILLPDQDLLLVTSEEGDVALVSATPDKHSELAKFKAIEGKTWNHPVLLGDLLLIRNGEEMAAFRLPAARR